MRGSNITLVGLIASTLTELMDTCPRSVVDAVPSRRLRAAKEVLLLAVTPMNMSVRRSETLDVIPPERLLSEADHPDGNRYRRAARPPGNIADVEIAAAVRHGITPQATRERACRKT